MRRTLTALGVAGVASAAWMGDLFGPWSETRVGSTTHNVRAAPTTRAPTVGRLAADVAFPVFRSADATKGCADGWGEVGGGWTCLDGTTPSDAPVRPQPAPLDFDPPAPDETSAYLAEGHWQRDPVPDGEGILPFIYGKRWMQFSGQEHASLEDFLAERPLQPLGGFAKYAFTDAVETERGTALIRPDGHVVPLDGVWVYPVTRFQGVYLTDAPEGTTPAWSIATKPLSLRDAPTAEGLEIATAPHHAGLWLDEDAPRGWAHARTADGVEGYTALGPNLRRWIDADPPAEVGPDEIWIDVDLSQQILAIRRGGSLHYATLVSTGVHGHETPVGRYRVMDKAAWWDMASLPESTQPYHLERVPWVAHIWPRYALHGAFWHNRFGQVTSHGCINLAPRDAAVVFDALSPTLPPGWWTAEATDAAPGTLVRVRDGRDTAVPDRTRSR